MATLTSTVMCGMQVSMTVSGLAGQLENSHWLYCSRWGFKSRTSLRAPTLGVGAKRRVARSGPSPCPRGAWARGKGSQTPREHTGVFSCHGVRPARASLLTIFVSRGTPRAWETPYSETCHPERSEGSHSLRSLQTRCFGAHLPVRAVHGKNAPQHDSFWAGWATRK